MGERRRRGALRAKFRCIAAFVVLQSGNEIRITHSGGTDHALASKDALQLRLQPIGHQLLL